MAHSGFYLQKGTKVKPVRVQTSIYMGNYVRLIFYQPITCEGVVDNAAHFSAKEFRCDPHKDSVSKLRSLYSLSRDDAEFIINNRVGPCEICGKETKRHLDHNHTTGKVRGLICSGCNRALGYLENDEWVTKAHEYLNGD